jgi:hypothetical protein
VRFFASKRMGSVRIGVSGDVGRKRVKPDSGLAAAIAEQEQAIADLEQSVDAVGRNTTECALRLADLDVDLGRRRAERTKMVADFAQLVSPEEHAQANAILAGLDASIAQMEAARTGLDSVMRTSAANHASGLRRLAECKAARDAALKRL